MNFPSDNKEHDCINSVTGKITFKECNNEQNIKKCSSLCQFYKHENYTGVNYGGIEITEVGRGKVINLANDFFVPNFYECLYCDVNDIEFSVVSISKVIVDVSFQIKPRVNREVDKRELYECDKWKKEASGIKEGKGPLIGIYSMNELPITVVGGKYKIEDRKEKVEKVSNILFTWMPEAKSIREPIDVSNMPEFPNQEKVMCDVVSGNMIEGKNNLILGEFYLNSVCF